MSTYNYEEKDEVSIEEQRRYKEYAERVIWYFSDSKNDTAPFVIETLKKVLNKCIFRRVHLGIINLCIKHMHADIRATLREGDMFYDWLNRQEPYDYNKYTQYEKA